MGRLTVAEMVVRWWHDYAAAELTHRTLAAYKVIWELHLLPRIGHLQMRQVTPLIVTRLRNDLHGDGVGAPTIRKGLGMLQAVWRQAIECEAADNPFRVVRKPRAPRRIAVVPFTVDQVEAMRRYPAERHGPAEAVLISVLAYMGPRPEDALAAEFRHVGKSTMLFEQKNVDGVIVPGSKTGERSRSVELLRHVGQDLMELRLRAGNPGDGSLLFPRSDGTPWREHDYRNWRTRHFKPAARAVGMPDARPYDLRHTYASLRLAEQRLSLREIADQMGNSLATLASTYAHVIADLKGQRPVDPDVLIARARRPKRSKGRKAS